MTEGCTLGTWNSRRRHPVGSVFHLALPLLGLWLLSSGPAFDGRWEHHGAHLWLVAAVGAASLALALGVQRAARVHQRRPPRARGARVLHRGGVPVAPRAGHAPSVRRRQLRLRRRRAARPVRRAPSSSRRRPSSGGAGARRRSCGGSRPAWWVLAAALAAYAVLSVATVGPFDRAITPAEAHGPLVLVAVGGGLLYLAACLVYARIYRRRRALMLLGLLTGFALLAEALVGIAYGRNWQASWWLWHLLMAAGFAFIVYSAHVQYRREGAAVPAVFGAVGLDETLDRIRRSTARRSRRWWMRCAGRIEVADIEGPVASQVGGRFDLSEGQQAVLEQAADALVHEREDVRRLGELVPMGREATVGRRGAGLPRRRTVRRRRVRRSTSCRPGGRQPDRTRRARRRTGSCALSAPSLSSGPDGPAGRSPAHSSCRGTRPVSSRVGGPGRIGPRDEAMASTRSPRSCRCRSRTSGCTSRSTSCSGSTWRRRS